MASQQSPAELRQQLGIERLVLQVHDASFPSNPDEDLGRGTPYLQGADRFFRWAADLGFNTIQLGPRGMTSRGNASPYDATIFSRNPLFLPLKRYVDLGRLSPATWQSIRRSLPAPQDGIVPYRLVYEAYQRALQEILATASQADRDAAEAFLAVHETWLIPDALYEPLCREHGSDVWGDWTQTEQGRFDQTLFSPLQGQAPDAAARRTALRKQYAREIEAYSLIQWLLDQEHQQLRKRLASLGLVLYGDLQVGLSLRDAWAWQGLFLREYRMGAPPSRTNPEGQPWGYSVLDPDQFGTAEAPGPALVFVRARIARMLGECDGLRVDHPHGWVDPWVYQTDMADALKAVQTGARLFSSPADSQHPQLARYAIAREDQIDPTQSLFADGHVKALDDEQVQKYSIQIDEIIRQQAARGVSSDAVACEVLSTLPYPVGRVMDRHGLGRFRVTQKLSLTDPADVYRIEQARPQDWIMLGTHDTASIWQLAGGWCGTPQGVAWGKYLAQFLVPPSERAALAAEVASGPGRLVNACFTAMLASAARNVVVFFPDLLGITARYNSPGVISDANWSLRVPERFEDYHQQQLQHESALDLEQCLRAAAGIRKSAS